MPSIPKDIHVQAVVQIGDPAKNIVQYSEEHPTDLIIIGNRGLSGLKKILLGSVSNYVLLRSQVPILIMSNVRVRVCLCNLSGHSVVYFTDVRISPVEPGNRPLHQVGRAHARTA